MCTLVICRDGRHPELYRVPAMAGAQILFHPSCSSDEVEAVIWKRTSDRSYALDSLKDPPFLRRYWEEMLKDVKERADMRPE